MTALAEPAERTGENAFAAQAVNYAATFTRDQWSAYFDKLNRRDDLRCTIQIEGDTVGGTEARELTLDSITFEDGDDQIAIVLGGRDSRYPGVLTHYAHRPRFVEVVGHDEVPHRLVIVGVDGSRTHLLFEPTSTDS
jgi:hypothetical protein